MNKKLRICIWIVFITYVAVLIDILLLKHGSALILASSLKGMPWTEKKEFINAIPFKTIAEFLNGNNSIGIVIQNILGNIFSFSPMGFLLPMLSKRFMKLKKIIYISVISSMLIEVMQLVFNLGSCDIDDIILNVFGAIIGYIVFSLFNKYSKRANENKSLPCN